jgi:undecaprenyl-diphosphatase
MVYNKSQLKGEGIMRKLSLRLPISLALCIGFGAIFGYIAFAIGNESIAPFDTAVIGFVQGLEAKWLTTFMKLISWIGSGYVVAPIAVIGFVVLFFVLHNRPQAFLFIVVIAGSVVFNSLLKKYFKRERPDIHQIIEENGFSFPSGHSMMALALYAIIAFIAWRYVKSLGGRVVLLLLSAFMIIIIGTSRIYLGVHYPSDVVGGFAVSAFWVTIAITVYWYLQNKRKVVSRP